MGIILKTNMIMRNKRFFFVFILLGMMLSGNVKAQVAVERSQQKTQISGKEYYLHQVKAGQTLYGIAEAYNVTLEEIQTLNPEVKDGLQAGHVLGIPVRPIKESPVVRPVPEEKPVIPEPESVVEEVKPVIPEPEPVVEEVKPVIPEPEPVVEEVKPVIAEPVVEENKPHEQVKVSADGRYTVKPDEDLYDIAKKFGIDVAEFRKINPGLTDNPAPGTSVKVPAIVNDNDYIIHYCERNERVSSLLRRWKVDESVFRSINVSVGSHVFVNQVVLIPIQRITDFPWMQPEQEGDLVMIEGTDEEEIEVPEPEANPFVVFDDEMKEAPVCVAAPENALRRYHVALMVPLYLSSVDNIIVSKENTAKASKSRAMTFLQFYEGFMMAVEALEKQGLKLDLTVLDVTDNTASAERALSEIRNKDLDLIVGPFFGKSFSIVEEYAKANDIIVVNPLTNRVSVIEDNANVVKVKPGEMGMVFTLSNLVRNAYSNANIFIVSRERAADSTFLNQLEHHLNMSVNSEVTVLGDDFLQFARNESERLEMGSRLVPTVDVEGQVYSTEDFRNGVTDKVVLANSVKRYSYSEMGTLKSQLSGVRENVIIAYGNENVFATQVLNSLTQTAERYPITLVCAPDWAKFEKLLVDRLLSMKAIYVSDYFVDYEDDAVKRFVSRFRSKYAVEPQQYAFEGYDVGYYFLSALMQFGNGFMDCLHCHQAPLLSTQYKFYYRNYLKGGRNDGKENLYWSTYQYDKEDVELVPIDPFKKAETTHK